MTRTHRSTDDPHIDRPTDGLHTDPQMAYTHISTYDGIKDLQMIHTYRPTDDPNKDLQMAHTHTRSDDPNNLQS